jgi:hypothetical protein
VLPDDLIRTIELVCDLHQVKHSSVETHSVWSAGGRCQQVICWRAKF